MPLSINSLVALVALSIGLIACITDLRTRRIPNVLTFGAAALALAFHGIVGGVPGVQSAALGWLAGHGHPDGFGLACLIVVCAACLVPFLIALPRHLRWLSP